MAGTSPRRPPVGFMLSDGEMLDRLSHIYGEKRIEAIEEEWAFMREHGLDSLVDERKERYCRRVCRLQPREGEDRAVSR